MLVSRPDRLRILVTQGDPLGIGPEVTLRALQRFDPGGCEIVLLAHPDEMARAAVALHVDASILDGLVPAPEPGPPSALWALEEACRRVCDGQGEAIVTAPVQKSDLVALGFGFPGQTEFLADRLGGGPPTMMLAGPQLRVALVTTHLPVSQVAAAITREGVERAVRHVHRALLECYGIDTPRIAVLGLNPHAGEDGVFGLEERDVIAPAVAACRAEGIHCEGPLPADGAFSPRIRTRFDALVAMYHDQGLTALKAVEGGRAVNVTLGLPVPRTSPDHGTARDIAGRGVADPASMLAALETARGLLVQGAAAGCPSKRCGPTEPVAD